MRIGGRGLQGVCKWQRQQPTHFIVIAGLDQALDPLGLHQAAGGVVNQHPVVRLGSPRQQFVQPVEHGFGASRATDTRQPATRPFEARYLLLEQRSPTAHREAETAKAHRG